MQDEGPSGGQDTDFILIDDDVSSPSSKLREIIQEQKAKIDVLTEKLQRAQWVINYLGSKTNSWRISIQSWSYKTFGKTTKLPKGGG